MVQEWELDTAEKAESPDISRWALAPGFFGYGMNREREQEPRARNVIPEASGTQSPRHSREPALTKVGVGKPDLWLRTDGFQLSHGGAPDQESFRSATAGACEAGLFATSGRLPRASVRRLRSLGQRVGVR